MTLDTGALGLARAQAIITTALAFARGKNLSPLAIAVLDARGTLLAFAAEDGISAMRDKIAIGKASGAIALGVGSRKISAMALERPHFIASVAHLVPNGAVPVPGGVLVRSRDGVLLGAVGVSGDSSDNDEAAAMTGIAAAGLVGDTG